MKHSKKILALAMSIAVVASIAAAGTLAYLTGNGSVTNTFNVGTQGKVDITLDESDLNGGRTEEGNTYENILPGQVLVKDPTVRVQANSAASYVFVAVENQLAAELNINTDAWEKVTNDIGKDVYKYVGTKAENGVIPATAAIVNLEPVFTTATVDKNLDAGGLEKQNGKQIIVQAFAIQADNLSESYEVEGETVTVEDSAVAEAAALSFFEAGAL